MYTSWASRMLLYIKGKEHGRMMLNSVLNGPLVYPTIEVDGVTRLKTYEEPQTKKNFKMIVIFVLRILYFKDGRVIVQQVQGRQSQGYASNSSKSNATASGGEGHMARQCTQPKRARNSAWFKEKLMLAEAHDSGQVLDEEQLAFLEDLGLPVGQDTQTTMLINAAFQNDDLDAFDPDCDEAPGAQAILMANLSSYDSDVISKILTIQVIAISSLFDAISDQVAKCTADNMKHKELDASLITELERYKERVKTFEQRLNVDLSSREK
ncbi:hypothetical protein Tco_0928545, partial [Tanacetum coccineum]